MSRWAIVTGSAGDIGAALVEFFIKKGYKVLGIDIKPERHIFSTKFLNVDLDVYCSDAAYRGCINRLIEEIFVADDVHVLINNAALQIVRPSAEISAEDWTKIMNINVGSAFLLTQALLPVLERSKGSVINIGSIHASMTKPGFAAYAASKAALTGLTRALAVDLGGRVRINAIAPAAIDTSMLREGFKDTPDKLKQLLEYHPSRKIGTSREVAEAAFFLANSDNGFVNGSIFQLDGGIGSRLHDPV